MSIASVIADQGTVALNLIIRDSLDKDALSFCSASGATDRLALSSFVRGVKSLGLWQNMVCWPLRSSQNSGGVDPTDTRVFSLGGLGTFQGTRVNGPTWGVDGVTGNGTSAYIATQMTTNRLTDLSASALFACGTNLETSGGASIMGSYSSVTDNCLLDAWEPTTARRRGMIGDSNKTAIQATALSTAFLTASSTSTSSLVLYSNGSSVGSNTLARTPSSGSRPMSILSANVLFGGNDGPAGFTSATISVAGIVNAGLSAQTVSALYTLYKSTLGTGLGLP
jgi:hypothetical protein